MDTERFKILRRNSLRNEVDGVFDELEEFEDRSEAVPYAVTHQECVMLHRVLSDKSRLPPACHAPPSVLVQNVSAQPSKREEGGGGLTTLARRMTEAVSSATQTKKELGGVVTEEQCRNLADYLSPSVGGLYLLPGACSRMLKAKNSDDEETAQYERENAEVYSRLKKRNSYVAKAGYPPTAC